MDLSIVIVTWNVRDLLENCLASIYRETRGISFEVFVIDNGSKDGTAQMVSSKFPTVKLIRNTENKGFSYSNNLGIRKSRGRFILLLNPDTLIFRDTFLDTLIFMEHHPECGIAGIHLLNRDYTHQDSVRRFPKFLDQALILLKLHLVFSQSRAMQRYVEKDFDYLVDEYGEDKGEKNFEEVNQVMGAYFMVRREVFQKIGLLDERFFVWMEEVDFCKRAYDAGFKIYYTRDAKAMHYYGAAFKQISSLRKQMIFAHSIRRYFIKHHGIAQYALIAFLSWISVALAAVIQITRAKERRNVTKSYIRKEKEYI